MDKREPFFAGVDWGTTRLRLWIMDATGAIHAEHRSDHGLLSVERGAFEAVLEKELSDLGATSDLPVVICGMAGSRQGWHEVPYLDLPVALDALGASSIRIPGTRRPVRILPGLAQRTPGAPDVMRGEETQIAGAAAGLAAGATVVCLPGTHSKWAQVTDGTLGAFSTFLTGELFALLAGHSILRHSVEASAPVEAVDPAFLTGLREALDDPTGITSRLFAIRAAGLLTDTSKSDATARLSGLLIGTEIAAARRKLLAFDPRLVLVVSGAIGALYRTAFNEAGLKPRVVDADDAVRAGLLKAARACLAAEE